jgi:hypothetical protein
MAHFALLLASAIDTVGVGRAAELRRMVEAEGARVTPDDPARFFDSGEFLLFVLYVEAFQQPGTEQTRFMAVHAREFESLWDTLGYTRVEEIRRLAVAFGRSR